MMTSSRPAESRRSTAAQFFMDEEDAPPPKEDKRTIQEKVVDLINQALLMTKDSGAKIQNLRQVQEFIIHQDRTLLDNFLDEVLGFQHDTQVDVRKFVVGFIEEACKNEPDILPKVVANLNMMLEDESPAVQKKVIQTATHLYKVALKWLCDARLVDDLMESTWTYMSQLKARILSLLDCENDGVRTHSIKFMEMLVILQTYPDTESPDKLEKEIALDDVPATLKIARPRKLEEEAKQIFDALIAFHGTPHISSVNLMGCMQTLTSIAKHRCEFMSKVIQALESLHANLPPTLAKSQVSSVRKHLKLQLLTLLKHPAAVDFHVQITVLLNDLGATQAEISKCLPKVEELRKRAKQVEDDRQLTAKRMKIDPEPEIEEDDDEEEDEVILEAEIVKTQPAVMTTNTAIDITAEDIMQRLTSVNVTDLVLVSMLSLPDQMPAQFQSSYTPIAVAGTDMQVKHLARLIATQVTAAGIGKGIEELIKSRENPPPLPPPKEDKDTNKIIGTLIGRRTRNYQDTKKKETKVPLVLLPTGLQAKPSRRIKAINLSENIRPLSDEQAERLCEITMRRIMDAERAAAQGGISQTRVKILSCLASQFKGHISDMLNSFIFEDLRNRADLAMSWLYEEYATYQCFNQMSRITGKPTPDHYDKCLYNLLHRLLDLRDYKDKDMLFARFFLDVPSIPENCIEVLSNYCQDEATVQQGLQTVRLLIEKRPPKQLLFLCVLLDLSLSEKPEIRNQSVRVAKQLHERGDLRPLIETFALKNLKYLLSPLPPDDMVPNKTKPPPPLWSEENAKICLHLYLALLPINHKLIHDLANVYVGTIADVKRTILRVLESPVKGMGMSSPELLLLVENCPKGAETLVTRIIHILTDKAPPSAELVSRVRDLYHKRVPDVRFLIPVLNGLTKKEVVAALPKLIKLNPIVVKEVFNRLLGSHAESSSSVTNPLTPAELLVALHNIDPSKCDMKTIIKATSLCFAEKHIYTQEVLAVVMQQLMDQSPLPTLLMRTVIQSLSLYPRLIGFVMNILQRLIIKQVWKQKKVWEGFIKCCQRTKPQSFQVLLQLPPPQLANAFQMSPELREPLLQHILNFTEHQRAHIPQAIMDLLQGPPEEEEKPIVIEPVPVLVENLVALNDGPSAILEDVSNDSESPFDSGDPEPILKVKEDSREATPPAQPEADAATVVATPPPSPTTTATPPPPEEVMEIDQGLEAT